MDYINARENSPTLKTNEKARRLEESGKRVYKFGFGESPFPVPEHIQHALKDNTHQKSYLPTKGLPELCGAITAYHRREDGMDITPDQIVIGAGSKPLLSNLQLAHTHTSLIISPYWVSYLPHAQTVKKPVQIIDTSYDEEWKIIPASIDKACEHFDSGHRPLLNMNYPSNPTGLSYDEDHLAALVEACRRNNVLVVADEIYGEMHHLNAHVSMAQLYPEGTIISSGLSKWSGAGGWRLGYMIFPQEERKLQDAVIGHLSDNISCVASPIQYAAIEAFEKNPDMDRYIHDSRRIMSALGKHCYSELSNVGIDVHHPDGGFYVFPSFERFKGKLFDKGVYTSEELCDLILKETGVLLLAGEAFGRPETELTARLAYVDFDGTKALEMAGVVPYEQDLELNFLIEECWKTVEGIDKLCDWVSSL